MSHTKKHVKKESTQHCCSHAIATPTASRQFTQASAEVAQSTFTIAQMDCPTEERLIRKVLEPRAEVQLLEFDLLNRRLHVIHDHGFGAHIEGLIAQLGMVAERDGDTVSSASKRGFGVSGRAWVRTLLAVALAIGAEIGVWMHLPFWLPATLAVLAIALCGMSVYKKGWLAIRRLDLNINALMSIAVTGAIVLGEWPEAAMVMSLFALAELIEQQSLDRARMAVDRLLSLAPEQVDVQVEGGSWQRQDAKTVAVGTYVRVLPGQRLALDGVIEAGRFTVNQAPITGESDLVVKGEGDVVYAGSINGTRELQYRTNADHDHSLLARITHSVQQAQQNKAPTQRFVDRFSRIYTPVVVLLALGVAVFPPLMGMGDFSQWIYRALVWLVIACPCALVISTPVAVVSALTAGARQGLLVKGGVHLERARQIQHVILDKTGTLTEGRPRVCDMLVLGESHDDVKQIAYSLGVRSDHPASQALATALKQESHIELTQFEAYPGLGVQASADGVDYRLGSRRWVLGDRQPPHKALEWEKNWQDEGAGLVFLASHDELLAVFAIRDAIKATSADALSRLHAMGVGITIASGDNQQAVASVAEELGIEAVHAALLPEDKLTLIAQHQRQGVVAMVGDGINDAPALAQADIGFAMGAMGSDIAIETADIAILNDDLHKVPYVIDLSTRLHRILVQNISAALAIKAVFLLLAFTGDATMWMAVFADVGASLLVILNSLRLLQVQQA